MAAVDVGAAARDADVAKGELEDAGGAHEGVADGVLRLPHAPDDGRGLVLGHGLGHLEYLGLRYTADIQHFVRRPFGHDVLAHLLHAVDAVVDVFLVLPAVLEDVIDHAEEEGDVAARPDAHILIGVGGGARKARVYHDHHGAVFLGMQRVQHRHRVRLGGVRADEQHRLAVLHVVVGIGHGAVTPGIRHARHGGGMADARLVVAVVRAPHGDELAHEIGLFVAVLGGADEIDGIRPVRLAHFKHPGGYLVQRHVPADFLVLAVDQFHRVLQASLAMTMLANGGTLGAMGTEVEGRIEHRFLADPDAVLHLGIDGAADRAMRAHGAFHLDLAASRGVRRLGLAHHGEGQLAGNGGNSSPCPDGHAGAFEEGAAIHGPGLHVSDAPAQPVGARRLRGA